jgi:hypothetical protein
VGVGTGTRDHPFVPAICAGVALLKREDTGAIKIMRLKDLSGFVNNVDCDSHGLGY